MKKILISLIILGLIGIIGYLIWNQDKENIEEKNIINNDNQTITKTIIPIASGHEVRLLDLKSNTLLSIPNNPEAEVVFGESIDGKWIIISEGKREIVPGPSPDFFLSGWNLYKINKETGEKLPIVLDKNVIVAVKSPKEDIIAYVTHTFGLWLVNLDGTNKRQIIPDYTVVAGNILWKKRTGEPFIFWSPDGKKIAFSTFPKGYKGGELWETQGVGIYFLEENKFKILGEDVYNVFNVWGWYDNENILVNIAQPFIYDSKKGEVLRSEGTGLSLIDIYGNVSNIINLTFIGDNFGSSINDILISNNKEIIILAPIEKPINDDLLNQDLAIMLINGRNDYEEPKIIATNLQGGSFKRFTPDGRIIYENRDGRLVLINLDGSNPQVLPPEIKPPIYFAP